MRHELSLATKNYSRPRRTLKYWSIGWLDGVEKVAKAVCRIKVVCNDETVAHRECRQSENYYIGTEQSGTIHVASSMVVSDLKSGGVRNGNGSTSIVFFR